MRARDVMTCPVATVAASAPVSEIADLLIKHRINAVPVVDGGRRLIGIVSTGDLLHRATDEHFTPPSSLWKESFWRRSTGRYSSEPDRADGRTAEEVMTARVVTVSPDADLVTVARELLEHRINALPVMTGDTMVGIISRSDVLSHLASHGDTINPLER